MFCKENFPDAKYNLSTVFLTRYLELCKDGGKVSIVLPENWNQTVNYLRFRQKILNNYTINQLVSLGNTAFQSIKLDFSVQIITISCELPHDDTLLTGQSDSKGDVIYGINLTDYTTSEEKEQNLKTLDLIELDQLRLKDNTDSKILFEYTEKGEYFNAYGNSYLGISCGDTPRVKRFFWEVPNNLSIWSPLQGTVSDTVMFGGNESVIRAGERERTILKVKGSTLRGKNAWDKPGVLISLMGPLHATLYSGLLFDVNSAILSPNDKSDIKAFWSFCVSDDFHDEVRKIDKSPKVTNGTLVKIPFDVNKWRLKGEEDYPNELPETFTNDPTQRFFHGHPCGSVIWDPINKRTTFGPFRINESVLQTAVARLVGFRWPMESDIEIKLASEQSEWVEICKSLEHFEDRDGIVCIPAMHGEEPASKRLLNLLVNAYGREWSNDTLPKLLTSVDYSGKSLEQWLRNKFFEQHCKLFKNRPFVWQIWDGLNDGFSALVNYQKLDQKLLESLIYTYLGDWINRQKDDISNKIDGAEEKLDAAKNLKKYLELILEGEKPYDIFVRWKSISEQPIGWDPDLDDGVRINIRPFIMAPDVRFKDAGVLRSKFRINWDIDAGKESENSPLYDILGEKRKNDCHFDLERKRKSV